MEDKTTQSIEENNTLFESIMRSMEHLFTYQPWLGGYHLNRHIPGMQTHFHFRV